jgi:hypothetical protein
MYTLALHKGTFFRRNPLPNIEARAVTIRIGGIRCCVDEFLGG